MASDECNHPLAGRVVLTPNGGDVICEACFARRFAGLKPMPAGSASAILAHKNGQFIMANAGSARNDIRRKTELRNQLTFRPLPPSR